MVSVSYPRVEVVTDFAEEADRGTFPEWAAFETALFAAAADHRVVIHRRAMN
jgi:hypothetical protein